MDYTDHLYTHVCFLCTIYSARTLSLWCRTQLRLVSSMIWDLDPTSMLLLSTARRSRFSATTPDPMSAASRKQGKRFDNGWNKCRLLKLNGCCLFSYKFAQGTTRVLKSSIRDFVDIKETVHVTTTEEMDIS